MLKSEWALTIFWALDKYPLPIRAEVLFLSLPLYIQEVALATVTVYTNVGALKTTKRVEKG